MSKNWIQNQPARALGHTSWLFVGILRVSYRVAAVIILIQSARTYGHDPYLIRGCLQSAASTVGQLI